MSLDWFNKIQKISIDNSAYQILNFRNENAVTVIEFLWGKIDFRAFGEVSDGFFTVGKIQIKRHGEWFDYQQVSSHGIFFEETQWKNDCGEIFIELPPKFIHIPEKIFAKLQSVQNVS